MGKHRSSNTRETSVTVYLRDDVEVTATVEIEFDPGERGPDGIGFIPGGASAVVLKHDAPFGLTAEEERLIEEKAIEDYEEEEPNAYDEG